ncbi:MAG: hypothetical protein PVI58_15515, partial [Desulfobacterales bacterium]
SIFNNQSSIYFERYPPASPVRRNLHMRESGTVNSDGGQAAAALLRYWLFVIGYSVSVICYSIFFATESRFF